MAVQDGHILVFGTGLAIQSYGLVQSYSIGEQTERLENKGPDGAILAIQDYGKNETLEMTYIPLGAEVNAPAVGTKFLFNSKSWNITSVNDIRVVDGFDTITVSAKYYDQIGESS